MKSKPRAPDFTMQYSSNGDGGALIKNAGSKETLRLNRLNYFLSAFWAQPIKKEHG